MKKKLKKKTIKGFEISVTDIWLNLFDRKDFSRPGFVVRFNIYKIYTNGKSVLAFENVELQVGDTLSLKEKGQNE